MHASGGILENWIFQLTLILIASRVGAVAVERVKMSAVIGEIGVGIILGASILGVLHPNEFLQRISTMGVIFMIFLVGLETKLDHILRVGKMALVVALAGVAVPFALGYGFGALAGYDWKTSMFFGAIMTATSVAITARVFMDMGVVRSGVSQTILAAAVIDDVVGLIVLTLVLALTGTSGRPLWVDFGLILGFLALVVPAFWWGVLRAHAWLKSHTGERMLLPFAFSALFLLSFLAEEVGLAAIVGAFLIGMMLASTPDHMFFLTGVNPVNVLLAPAFFVVAGIQVNMGAMMTAFGFTLVFFALAVLGKIGGCGLSALCLGANWRKSLLIGAGMIPRGEVGLIVALIGKQAKLLDDAAFTAAAMMAVLTTLIAPLLLKPMAGAWPDEMKEA
ncbi:MAG: cation:proton antiporter [Candidatus Tectomicrobia bacterium]|uniref:Cation:proton antiporter n=1 Tax=Tectimicrobiota bacterium TaxID=2528274 RepID=A0A932HZZ1_UNCTE|nr:cation:proton antiporter [Candidatus Tectomicrobia bacterium]